MCVKADSYSESNEDPDFYGVLDEILEVQYPGVIGLKTIIFRCNWYDTSAQGMRRARWGGIEINAERGYSKNEPFILSSQADQVCFLSYPTLKRRRDAWCAIVKINPRGVLTTENNVQEIEVQQNDAPLQEENDEPVIPLQLTALNRLVHHDIDAEIVNEFDQTVNDAELDDEFATDSNEDDSTETDPNSL